MPPAWIPPSPLSDQQQAAVRAELHRILNSPDFSGSRRASEFLTYSVERTLSGALESDLKERTIAVEVFGRSPGYDSNDDSIVRVAARDVRKRLAQCYVAIGPEHAVRIDLPAGSYRAEFHWPEAVAAVADVPAPVVGSAEKQRVRWRIPALAAALVIAAFGGWLAGRHQAPVPDVIQSFWQPLIQSSSSIVVCVGTPAVYDVSDRLRAEYSQTLPPEARMRPFVIPFRPDQKVAGSDLVPVPGLYAGFGNVHTAADLVGLMTRIGKPWQVRAAGDVSFAELRESAAVLVGGESNVWTQPLTTELRFYFSREGAVAIHDRTQPSVQWPAAGAPERKSEDYAIMSRILDSKTGKGLVFLGGRTQSGTQAAGELVTHAEQLANALRGAPPNWPRRNIQMVIRTQIHGLTPSAPVVLASHYW